MKSSQSLVAQLRCVVLSPPVPRCAVRHNIRNRFGIRNYSTIKKPAPSKLVPSKATSLKQAAPKVNAPPRKPVKAVAAKPYTPSQTWKPTAQKAAPENVLIYHAGTGKIVFLGMLRTATIFVAGVSSMIIAPAFFADEFPSYLAPLIVIGGALPLIFVAYTTAPFVNNIYIHLPIFARKSREAALEYVKNLPSSATLSIRTMKITTIPRTTENWKLSPSQRYSMAIV
uniref:60S ribosomal protein L6-1 n=1 Tax=Talaromyces marneffei PM1 TaxID=1077442 RepID=A0A093V6Q0_TALMA